MRPISQNKSIAALLQIIIRAVAWSGCSASRHRFGTSAWLKNRRSHDGATERFEISLAATDDGCCKTPANRFANRQKLRVSATIPFERNMLMPLAKLQKCPHMHAVQTAMLPHVRANGLSAQGLTYRRVTPMSPMECWQ